MEFALDRWITKHNAWIDVFVPNYMRWIFHDVKMTILFLGSFSLVKCCRCLRQVCYWEQCLAYCLRQG